MCREFCGRLTIFLRMRRSTLSGKCWILAGRLDMRFTTSTGLATSSCWLSCGLFRIRFGCGCLEGLGRSRGWRKGITAEDAGEHGDAQGTTGSDTWIRHLDPTGAGDENQLEAEAALVLAGAGVVVSSAVETSSMWGPGVVTG